MRRWLVAAVLVAGCRGQTFDPASFLTGLRVLAVKAEPPELAPGQTATLTPLVVDVGDGAAADASSVTLEWFVCNEAPPPGRSTNNDCVAADASNVLTRLGEGPTMQVTMPDVRADQLGVPDATGGVYLPIVLYASDGNEKVTAVYRLRYTQLIQTPFGAFPLQQPNHNPTIASVDAVPAHDAGAPMPFDDTTPLVLSAGGQTNLRATFTPDSHEIYRQFEGTIPALPDGGFRGGGIQIVDGGIDVNGMRVANDTTELLRVSWFSSAGSLDPDVTGEQLTDGGVDIHDSTFKLDKHVPAAPADIDLYVVARDERGGIDFTHRTVHLQ